MIHVTRLVVLLSAAFQTAPRPQLAVTVDSARHRVVLTYGPFDVAAHSGHMMDGEVAMERFRWPLDAWLRGFQMAVLDSGNRPLSRRLVHHFNLVDFDRRELAYPIVERLLGGGQETEDVLLPATVGLPVVAGHTFGLTLMWRNDTGQNLSQIRFRLTLSWIPRNEVPRPVGAMPIWVDVNWQALGPDDFDAPPGASVKAYAFRLPIGGHLLAASGHLHRGGVSLWIADAENGGVIARSDARRDSAGQVLGMSRTLFGVRGMGPHLEAHHRYVLIAVYDNPTLEPLKSVMAIFVGLFAPDHPDEWPAADPRDSLYQADLAGLTAPPMDMSMDH